MTDTADFHVNGWDCSFARFNSAELSLIAGIPGPIQRLWRSRGLLPKGIANKPTFTSRDVAEITVRYDLSKLGVPPSDSAIVGRLAANLVLWFALINSDGTCEVLGSPGATSDFLRKFDEDESIAGDLCGNPDVTRYMFWSTSSQIVFLADLAAAIDSSDSRSGAFLDLEQTAAELVMRAKRPLVTVELGTASEESSVRRLSGQRQPKLWLV